MTPSRKIALTGGLWFIGTFVFSIPAVLLYDSILNDTDYIVSAGDDTNVRIGALLELLLCVANVATALALFPVLKRQNEGLSLSYVAVRIFESVMIAVGIIALLSVVTLRADVGGLDAMDPDRLMDIGRSLVAVHDWTFLFGPGICAGLGNGVLLGFLMFRSRLVPRQMAILGLVGGPLLLASDIGVLFDAWDQTSSTAFIITVPEILWEASFGIWLTFKGFTPSPIADAYDAAQVAGA